MNHKSKMKQCAVYYAAQWVLLPLGLLLSQCLPVHAYIDPSVMTYAIQAVAGILNTAQCSVSKSTQKDPEEQFCR